MKIQSKNPIEQKTIQQVYEAGQGHVFKFWNELNQASRKHLLAQLKEVEFKLMSDLYCKFIESPGSHLIQGELEPAYFIAIPKTAQEIEVAYQANN